MQSTDFDVIADAECRVMAGRVGNVGAVFAADDWDLVLFELLTDELSSDGSHG